MKAITLVAPAIIAGAVLIKRKGKAMATTKKSTTAKKAVKKTTKKSVATKKQLDALKKGREALKKKSASAKKAVRKELTKTKKAVKKATSKIMTTARKKATKVASKKMDNLTKSLKKKGLAGGDESKYTSLISIHEKKGGTASGIAEYMIKSNNLSLLKKESMSVIKDNAKKQDEWLINIVDVNRGKCVFYKEDENKSVNMRPRNKKAGLSGTKEWTAKKVRDYARLFGCKIYTAPDADMQFILKGIDRDAFTSGTYGWNADVYTFDKVIIVVGSRPFGSKIPESVYKKYAEKARNVEGWGESAKKKREVIRNQFLKELEEL